MEHDLGGISANLSNREFCRQFAAGLSRTFQPPDIPSFTPGIAAPNAAQVEAILARLEGAESALLVGSGMGAVTLSVLGLIEHGMHVVAQTSHYGGTVTLLQEVLPRLGVSVTQVNQRDPSAFAAALRPHTKLVLLETPSNPRLWLTDLRAVAGIARAHSALTVIDGTFATPLNQQPLQLGLIWWCIVRRNISADTAMSSPVWCSVRPS